MAALHVPMLRPWWRDERGATMVEYGLILALVALVCIGAAATIGREASSFFFPLVANSL